MSKKFRAALTPIALALATLVLAATAKAAGYEEVISDIEKVAAALRPQIRVLKRPVYVYHWFNAAGDPKWQKKLQSSDPMGAKYVRDGAAKYWWNKSPENRDHSYSLFGNGLYAASNPTSSRIHGSSNWVLMQIKLPAGFRLFELDGIAHAWMSNDVSDVLKRYGCVSDTFQSTSTDSLFYRSNYVDERCPVFLQEVFNEKLKLDGFAYPYSTQFNMGCRVGSRKHFDSAFVLTNNRLLTPEGIHLFNKKTRDNRTNRIRIQGAIDSEVGTKLSSDKMGDPIWERLRNLFLGRESAYLR